MVDKTLKKAHAALEILQNKPSLSNYGFVYEKRENRLWTGMACYYALGGVRHIGNVEKPKYFIDYVWCNPGGREILDRNERMHGTPKEGTLEYIDFILNRSAWSDAFVTKDADEVVDRGSVLRTDMDVRYILTAAMLFRYIYEIPAHVPKWLSIKDHVDPSVAILFTHCLQVGKDNRIEVWKVGDGHRILSGYDVTKQRVWNVMHKQYDDGEKRPTMAENSSYTGLRKIWSYVPAPFKDGDGMFSFNVGGLEKVKKKNSLGLNMVANLSGSGSLSKKFERMMINNFGDHYAK